MVYLQLIGAIGIMLRFWLVEKKLVDELQFRRHYISRMLNYYLCIGLMLELKSDIFNLAILIPFPIVWVSVIGWDSLFFKKFKSRTYWEKNHFWLIIERLTLHIPMVIVQIYMLVQGPLNFVDMDNIVVEFICVIILLYIPWLFWDKRWLDKEFLPDTRRDISVFVQFCVIGFIIYFAVV